jgi:hypothetical protein
MKKEWKRPQLVSLFRGKPEEKVLCGCKLMSGGGPTEGYNHQCDKSSGGYHSSCVACSVGSAS